MSRHSRIYTLSETTKKHLKHMGMNLICNRCRKPLRTGQSVISKKGYRDRSTRHYHSGCYASLYM